MKALIIYENLSSAEEANAVLKRSAQHSDMSINWNVRPWGVNLLKFPPAAEEALTEAIDAHLIVFTGFANQPFPAWLNDWLEHWAKCRRIDEAALAVIDDPQNSFSRSAASELSRFANQRGLGFIVSDVAALENRQALSAGSTPDCKAPPSFILPGHVIGTPAHDSNSSWSS